MSDMLSANFSRKELDCNCGCGMIPQQSTIDSLQALRQLWGKPLKITSAARCKTYNAKIGGAPNSQHVLGKAVDVEMPIEDRWAFVRMAMSLSWTGIGIANSFIHLDRRDGMQARIWKYGNK